MAKIIASKSSALTPASANAFCDAGSAKSLANSPGAARWRARMPVRSRTHSSEVSTHSRSSSLLTRLSGKCPPTPTTAEYTSAIGLTTGGGFGFCLFGFFLRGFVLRLRLRFALRFGRLCLRLRFARGFGRGGFGFRRFLSDFLLRLQRQRIDNRRENLPAAVITVFGQMMAAVQFAGRGIGRQRRRRKRGVRAAVSAARRGFFVLLNSHCRFLCGCGVRAKPLFYLIKAVFRFPRPAPAPQRRAALAFARPLQRESALVAADLRAPV